PTQESHRCPPGSRPLVGPGRDLTNTIRAGFRNVSARESSSECRKPSDGRLREQADGRKSFMINDLMLIATSLRLSAAASLATPWVGAVAARILAPTRRPA